MSKRRTTLEIVARHAGSVGDCSKGAGAEIVTCSHGVCNERHRIRD
jgi:hypothetical protein